MGFAGFRPAALGFLRDLASHQTKAWFDANKAVYDAELKRPLATLVTALAEECAARGIPLTGDPRQSLFRINRDVRFSHDKSPYKTNAGAVWFRPGSGKNGAGVLYFHLAAAGCFMAAAFYHPDKDTLETIREGIRVRPEQFLAMTGLLAQAGLTLEQGEALSRMPRGFEDLAGSEVAPFLKLRDFIVRRPLGSGEIERPALADTLVAFAHDAMPLLQFGWRAVDEVAGR